MPPPVLLLCLCVATERLVGSLIRAAVNGRTAIVEALIKAGANLDLQDEVSDSRTSPPPFCLNFKDFFMIPWTLARAVGGYLVARKFRAKMAEKMPQNKTT